MNFIELDRSFTLFSKTEETYLAMPQIWGGKIATEFRWPDLLTRWRVILLAEASSGKSEEFRNQVGKLTAGGQAAFYVRIEELAESGFDQALDSVASAKFTSWRESADEGWFFLDSVDEARLNRKNFESALKRFERDLGQFSLDRAHIYISSRVSDWQGAADIAVIHRTLPFRKSSPPIQPIVVDDNERLLAPIFGKNRTKQTTQEKEQATGSIEPLLVQLVPLSKEQCQTLAKAAGIDNVAGFMGGLTRNGLHELAERPGDLLELVNYWKSYQRFGNLAEMVEHSINVKLQERDNYRPDSDILALTKAREGAEKLAAALTFCKTFTLRTPGDGNEPDLTAGALDPDTILADWTDTERATLLRRGIFAPSTYGRIRFHQRSTQEYLAAKWLNRLLNANCPQQEIWDCIFTEKYGLETVILSLRAEAAWLALWQSDFCEEIIRREPMILLQYGDPRSLPIHVRERILASYAAKHAAAEIADDRTDRRALWLFADPELANAIRSAWQSNPRQDFKWNLLCLIREASITACVDLAREVALDDSAGDYERMVALDAINACGDQEGLAEASRFLMTNFPVLNVGLISRFATTLFPKYLNVHELLTLIAQSKNTRQSEGFGHQLATLYHVCSDVPTRTRFATGLADLCLSPPFVADYQRISEQYQELATYLEPLARHEIQLLSEQDPPDHLIRLLMAIERAEHQVTMPADGELSLQLLINQHWRIRRALFWSDVKEQTLNSPHRDYSISLWRVDVHNRPLWELSEGDLPWLYHELSVREAHEDRYVSLDAILCILGPTDKLTTELVRLRELVKHDATLSNSLEEYLKPALAPPTQTKEESRYKREIKQMEQERAKREENEKAWWIEFRNRLQENPDQLRYRGSSSASSFYDDLIALTEWLSREANLTYHKAPKEWRSLSPVFGQDVAEAYRDGMKAVWRITEPERPTREPGGTSHTKWVMVLSYGGIVMEATEDPQWTVNLSTQEAERAACHGLFSEHGYPEWMDGLIRSHPGSVLPILKQAFTDEWMSQPPHWPQLLYSFSDAALSLQLLLQQLLLEVILAEEPVDINKLDRGLRVIKKLALSAEQKQQLIVMARDRLASHMAARHDDYALRYIALLLLLDINNTIGSLTIWLENAPQEQHKTRAEQGLAILFDRHDPLLSEALSEASVSTPTAP